MIEPLRVTVALWSFAGRVAEAAAESERHFSPRLATVAADLFDPDGG
jgi:hypothetical protein